MFLANDQRHIMIRFVRNCESAILFYMHNIDLPLIQSHIFGHAGPRLRNGFKGNAGRRCSRDGE